jgi:hypothetical protein
MPIRRVPNSDVEYYLISYDENGKERPEPDGTMLSRAAIQRVSDPANPVTDVFYTSHGWKGDMKGAIEQYDSWVGAMAALSADREVASNSRPGFAPLVVGLHWPSLPWGDEEIPAEGAGGLLSGDDDDTSIERQVDAYAHRIADTPAARESIRTILEAANEEQGDTLSPRLRDAYDTLFAESGLGADDVAAAPGADQDGWDPQRIIDQDKEDSANETAGAAPGLLGGGFMDSIKEHLLSPLRQISFWKMKDRARLFGESGAHELLAAMQRAAPPDTRFHLMGHSFGCIVASATVAGAAAGTPLPRPVDSLFLVQGALSLWSFAQDIPYAAGTPGYFNRIVRDGLVQGPIVTTRSKHDHAVGTFYPRGAQVKKQLVLGDDDFPKYGGIGSFGIQGVAGATEDRPMQAATATYGFQPGRIYNLEASAIIKEGSGASGAHSDIAHPEVAHAFWEAALAGA